MDLTSISKTTRIVLKILSAIILFVVSLLFFLQLPSLLTSTKIFTLNIRELFSILILPIALFVLFLVILTYCVAITKTFLVTLGIPIAFIFSQGFSIFSLATGLVMLFSMFLFARSFLDDLDNFKRPSISRCVNVALGFPITLFTISIILNFFPVYSNTINGENLSFDNNIKNLIYEISSGLPNSSQSGFDKDDTVRSFAIKTLHDQEQPITERNIQTVEAQIFKQFGMEVDENTKIMDLQTKLIESKFSEIIKTNSTQALIVILFIIFLTFETFIKLASWIASLIIYLIEMVLSVLKVKLFPEYIPENQKN